MSVFTKVFSTFLQRKAPKSSVVYTSDTQFTCHTGTFLKRENGNFLNVATREELTPLTFYASLVETDRPFFTKPPHFYNDMSLENARNVQEQLDAIQTYEDDEKRRNDIMTNAKAVPLFG